MAAQITLTVNTQPALEGLYQVNDAINQVKMNGQNITIGTTNSSGATEKIKKVSKEVDNLGKSAENASQKATGGIVSMTSQGRKAFNNLRQLFTGMVSWWTAVVIAVEVAAKTFTYFWNNLTENIQKLTTRGQHAIKVAQQHQKKFDDQTKAAQNLIQKLIELNKLQSLSNDQRRLAASIVSKLNKQYGDLGITIDSTTNKYRGLYQAQRKIDERNKRQQINTIKKEMTGQREVVNAALKEALGTQLKLGDKATGSDFFTIAEQLGGTFGAQNADLLAQKWNTGDIRKQLEVIDQLIQGLSSSERFMKAAPGLRDAMQQLVDYRDQLRQLTGVDSEIVDANERVNNALKQQKDKLKGTKEQVDKLAQAYKDAQRASQLAAMAPEDRKKAIEEEVKALEDKNAQLQKSIDAQEEQTRYKRMNSAVNRVNLQRVQEEQKALQQRIEQLEKKRDQLNDKVVLAQQRYEESYVDTDPRTAKEIRQEQQQNRERRRRNYYDLIGQQTRNDSELKTAQKQLAALRQQAQRFEVGYAETTQVALDADQHIVELEKERQENLNAIQAKTQQIAAIEKQIEQAKKKQAEEQQKRIDAVNDIFSGYEEKQTLAYMKMIGKQKQAVMLQARLNAERAKGEKLTEEELAALQGYIDVQQMIEDASNVPKIELNTNGVITNQLASKGGFASSVVTDRAQDINKEILNQTKKQTGISTQIRNAIEKYSVIQ